jgi:hypothetical protein
MLWLCLSMTVQKNKIMTAGVKSGAGLQSPASFPFAGGGISRRHLCAGMAAALTMRTATLHAADAEVIHFDMFYKSFGVRGIEFSDRLKNFVNKTVAIKGFMAPPLKPESQFFVMTREPLAICPFCQSDADWPLDIVVVYLKQASAMISAGTAIDVTGTLALGSYQDAETGFVSQLRVIDATYRKSR